jgi:flagellar motor switch protein FliG
MSNESLKKLIKDVDVENWVYALKDAGEEFTEKIVPNFTKKAAKEYDKLKEEIKIRKTDIEASRKSISEKISKLFS